VKRRTYEMRANVNREQLKKHRQLFNLYIQYIMDKEILETLEQTAEVEEKEEENEVVVEVEDDNIQAPKKPRTQKQIDAFKLVCEKQTLAREARVVEREQKAIEDKKELDDKIVKKAIKITRKKIKAEKILEDKEESDGELQQKRPTSKAVKSVPIKPLEVPTKPKVVITFV
jgi:hypothetical protein